MDDARNYEEKKIANDQNELRAMIKKRAEEIYSSSMSQSFNTQSTNSLWHNERDIEELIWWDTMRKSQLSVTSSRDLTQKDRQSKSSAIDWNSFSDDAAAATTRTTGIKQAIEKSKVCRKWLSKTITRLSVNCISFYLFHLEKKVLIYHKHELTNQRRILLLCEKFINEELIVVQ